MQTKSLKISIPHRLTRGEAARRLRDGIGNLKAQHGASLSQVEERWEGDHLDFKVSAFGQSLTGRLDVKDNAVDVEIDLPWLFAVLAEKIKGQIQQAGMKLLEKK